MKSKKTFALLVSSLLAVTGLVGCNNSGGDSSLSSSSVAPSSSAPSEAPTITNVTADAGCTELVVGDEEFGGTKIKVEVSGTGDFSDEVTFVSSDASVLTVDKDGKVVAVKNGEAKVTVTSVMDTTKSCEVAFTVVPAYVESIKSDLGSAYLIVEDVPSAVLNVWLLKHGEAASDDLQVDTLDADVATATFDAEKGELTINAVDVGSTQIVVTAEGGVTRHFDVIVKAKGSKKPFTGGKSYVDSPAEDRLQILGILERYAMAHNITGISIMGNGGYMMYADGVEKGAPSYIPGFGFATLSDGSITKPLTGNGVKEEYNMYYHTYLSDDPGTINYMNDKGSVVGDIVGYTNGGYHGTFMNNTMSGYDWVKDLSTEDRPIGIDSDGSVLTDKTKKTDTYRIPLRTDVKYHTFSTNPLTASFLDREVAIEDYLTPYKIYYTQSYGMARGSENLTGSGSIKGAEEYYKASAKGFSQEAFDKLGIHIYKDDSTGEQGLEFVFNTPCTPFYAMYYLASSMFAPVPAAFIEGLGGVKEGATAAEKEAAFAAGTAVWGCFSKDLTLSPVDTSLSTGPYSLKVWAADSEIVFVKNPNYAARDSKHYSIDGIHYDILSAIKTDPEAGLNEFLAGNLSACSIPSTKKSEWIGKPGVLATEGDSNFKINVNTCNEEQWEALFGVNGSITQTAKEDYWEVEPALSNPDFVKAISFAIDRKGFAEALGRTTGFEYFANVYLSDPENGESYNSTDVHKANLEHFGIDAETCGYSLESAKNSFNKALTELLEEGAYEDGETIHLEIAWQDASDEDTYHKLIKGYLETAFNTCSVAVEHNLTLSCDFWVSAVWSDVYYAKMMVGQFDLGFGSVSGNTYDPLNFLEVLKSDNSSGFTLNWGIDTSTITDEIEYDGSVWSFAGLWQAADTGAYFENGVISKLVDCDEGSFEVKDGAYTVTIPVTQKKVDDDTWGEFTSLCIFATDDADYETYTELYVDKYNKDGSLNDAWKVSDDGNTVTVTFSAAQVASFKEAHPGALMFGFDIYYVQSICGAESNSIFYTTVYQEMGGLK